MKIPPEKLKPFSTEMAPECAKLIEGLKNAGDVTKFTTQLDNITEWCSVFGKTEMGRWAKVLDDCDAILESATTMDTNEIMGIDTGDSLEQPLISVLRFTSLLFENTFSRSIYNSMERILKLLDSRKIWIVVQTLRLLMIISKSSRFFSHHLTGSIRIEICNRLTALLETWGSKLRGITFADFCSDSFIIPTNLLSIQLRPEVASYQIEPNNKTLTESTIELKAFMNNLQLDLQEAEKIFVFTKLRFAYSIHNQNERFYQVMARLISTSIIFYSKTFLLGDESKLNTLASEQYIEQCCQLLHFVAPPNFKSLSDAMKTETLKTLASIVFLEKPKKLQLIVDSLELKSYHGFGPILLRKCVELLKAGRLEPSGECSIAFVTALFSLIYHLAGLEYGGDSLNRSSMVSLFMSVVKTYTLPENYISYVTRAVRIVDILTGMDVTEFNSNDGTDAIVQRFTNEIEQSKAHMETMQTSGDTLFLCKQQRSALMKSLLNFLKRAVLDVNLAPQMRRIMDTDLPLALVHIIQNPQYYGSSLLQCSLLLITNFIYREPAQLTMLQQKGLTDAILNLVLSDKLPISRDLICTLPNVFTALCLNERGLNEIKSYNNQKPLMNVLNAIFSNKFLLSMRKRKAEILETAHMLGTHFDDLIRHQPTLRKEVMMIIASIIDTMLEQSQNKYEISWSIGKTVLEGETATLHLPLGDFLAILGVLLETVLTNRGNHENIQVLNDCGIPLRLIKILSQAEKPNQVFLNSTFLPNLANILCCVMRQLNKVDEAFIHLVASCANELSAYSSIKEDSQERLYQITRLSSLISTMNNLMKSVIHPQSPYDIRPVLLHHFSTDANAKHFIVTLFDTYKLMSSDKLLSAVHQTTNQILDDATKVQELLRINDDMNVMDTDDAVVMEIGVGPDQSDGASSSRNMSESSTDQHATQVQTETNNMNGQQQQPSTSNDETSLAMTMAPATTAIETAAATERSINNVASRCQRQMAELIVCIGKSFSNPTVTRTRQRAAQNLQLNQDTLKKDYQEVSKLIFSSFRRLLHSNENDNTSASHVTQSLSLLKKMLVDDYQSIQQLLPEFFLSGCHQTFFILAENHFAANLTRDGYINAINAWLNISQKLTSSAMLLEGSKQGRNGSRQQPQQRVSVDGFELKHYLAKSQKDTFTAINSLMKVLINHCQEKTKGNKEDDKLYKLLEKLMESLKFLLKDMLKLLELTEGKADAAAEVPVNAIDPDRIRQIADMGFSQSDALDALIQFGTVADAAEYLINMQERNMAPSTARQLSPVPQQDQPAASNAALNDEAMPDSNGSQQKTTNSAMATNGMKSFAELAPLNREDLQQTFELCREIINNSIGLINRSHFVVVGLSELIAVFAEDQLACSWVLDEFVPRLLKQMDMEMDRLRELPKADDDPELVDQLAATMKLFNLVWQAFPNQNIHKQFNNTENDDDYTMGL